MPSKAELENRLKQIDAQIRATEARLPAHSVKPPIMTALFELEDEREVILAQLKALSEKNE